MHTSSLLILAAASLISTGALASREHNDDPKARAEERKRAECMVAEAKVKDSSVKFSQRVEACMKK